MVGAKVRLTDEEITRIVERATPPRGSYKRDIAKATLRVVAEWMENNSFHSNSAEFQRASAEGQVNCFNEREWQEALLEEVK